METKKYKEIEELLTEITLTVEVFEEKMRNENNPLREEISEIREKLTDDEFRLLATSLISSHSLVISELNNIKAEERGC